MFSMFSASKHIEHLSLFTRHVAGAMASRAPLPEILRAYLHETDGGPLARAVARMTEQVESGVPLSAAMEKHTALFPSAYRRLVRLGEQGHSLGGIMHHLADTLDEGLRTFESFRRVAVYPLIVMVLLFLDFMFVLYKITPKMTAIYDEMGARFPGPLGAAELMQALTWGFGLLLLVPTAFLLATVLGLKIKAVGSGRVMLSLPLVGPVLRRAEIARFAHHLALLLEHNIPLAEALSLMTDASPNTYVQAAVADLQRRYEAGERLGDLMARQPLFPPSMAIMIASAEDQGGLAQTLRSLGKFYDERTSHGLGMLREAFEPMMVLVIGLLVAVMLVGLYGPLFNMSGLIR